MKEYNLKEEFEKKTTENTVTPNTVMGVIDYAEMDTVLENGTGWITFNDSSEITIPEARKRMRDSFTEDPGFLEAYVANVAMLLHDQFQKADFTDKDVREAAGRKILKLIFWS